MAIPDWKLERILLGEEPEEGLSAGDRARLERLRASNEEILRLHPPKLMAEGIERKLRPAPAARTARATASWFRPVLVAAPALAGLALVLFLVQPGTEPLTTADGREITREKGEVLPSLVVHRRTAGGSERLAPGATARQGDVLQLSYAAAGVAHGVILSIDGRGSVTLHHPASGTSTELVAGYPVVPLAESYELDDAPGFERFFLVTSPGPIDVGAVRAAAETLAGTPAARTAALALPAGLVQASFLVVKP